MDVGLFLHQIHSALWVIFTFGVTETQLTLALSVKVAMFYNTGDSVTVHGIFVFVVIYFLILECDVFHEYSLILHTGLCVCPIGLCVSPGR